MISESDLSEMRERMAANARIPSNPAPISRSEFRLPLSILDDIPPAVGRIQKPDMNKTEAEYSAHLTRLYITKDILWRGFEAITIKLGPDCRLTPDFLVMYPDGHLELHDTKGTKKIKTGKRAGGTAFYAEEDALVKARVVAGNFVIPIFFVWREKNGEWSKKQI